MQGSIDIGKNGEDMASDFLKKNGYKILLRNYRKRCGEIDIIAVDGDFLCFVEVKSRKNSDFGEPAEFITRKKQQKIIKTALFYLKEKDCFDKNVRFDSVSVLTDECPPKIELIKGAFESA